MTATGLRVAFVGPHPPVRGGVAQHGGRLVDALVDRGHDVQVSSWAAQYPRLLYRGDQASVGHRREGRVVHDLRWWAPWTWVRAGVRARRADLVVLPWVHPFHALALLVVVVVARRPVVGLVHNLTPHERLPGDRALARLVLRRCVGVVVHATEVEVETRAALPTVPLARVAHPPNMPFDARPLPAAARPRVLFLGFVRPYKGLDVLLDAVADDARLAGVELTVAGEAWDPDEETLTADVAARGLADRVALELGYVADERMVALLHEHHLLAAPYRSATQSGLVPLAHAAGRPVVATAVGGLPDQVRDGVDGVLAPGPDPVAFADALVAALARIEELAAGAAAAAPRWDDVAAAIEELATARTGGAHR